MKKKILVVVSLLVVVAMLTTGAFAWFTSTKTITGSRITTGTLDLQLKNDCNNPSVPWGDSALAWNFEGMAPGDTVEQTICMKNNGSIPAGYVYYDWTSLLENPAGVDFAKKLIIMDIQDDLDHGLNQVGVFNNIGVFTLYDLATKLGAHDVWSATSVYPYLGANGEGWLYMKLKFDENAGNEFKGIVLTYNLVLEAVQEVH